MVNPFTGELDHFLVPEQEHQSCNYPLSCVIFHKITPVVIHTFKLYFKLSSLKKTPFIYNPLIACTLFLHSFLKTRCDICLYFPVSYALLSLPLHLFVPTNPVKLP